MRSLTKKENISFFPCVVQEENGEALNLLKKVGKKFQIEIVPPEKFYLGLPLAFPALATPTGLHIGVEDIEFFVNKNMST